METLEREEMSEPDFELVRDDLSHLIRDASPSALVTIHNSLVAYCEGMEHPEALRALRHATGHRRFPDAAEIRRYLPGPQIDV
jgi:hypothetical protein